MAGRCGKGHALVSEQQETPNQCAICNNIGTVFRCSEGCDWDICKKCALAQAQQRASAFNESNEQDLSVLIAHWNHTGKADRPEGKAKGKGKGKAKGKAGAKGRTTFEEQSRMRRPDANSSSHPSSPSASVVGAPSASTSTRSSSRRGNVVAAPSPGTSRSSSRDLSTAAVSTHSPSQEQQMIVRHEVQELRQRKDEKQDFCTRVWYHILLFLTYWFGADQYDYSGEGTYDVDDIEVIFGKKPQAVKKADLNRAYSASSITRSISAATVSERSPLKSAQGGELERSNSGSTSGTATSPEAPKRKSCKLGASCTQRYIPAHAAVLAHPGDPDYEAPGRKSFDAAMENEFDDTVRVGKADEQVHVSKAPHSASLDSIVACFEVTDDNADECESVDTTDTNLKHTLQVLEKRHDPRTGNWFTYAELKSSRGSAYEDTKIRDYWDKQMLQAEERRCSPYDGKWYTLEEVVEAYSGTHTGDQIQSYWEGEMRKAISCHKCGRPIFSSRGICFCARQPALRKAAQPRSPKWKQWQNQLRSGTVSEHRPINESDSVYCEHQSATPISSERSDRFGYNSSPRRGDSSSMFAESDYGADSVDVESVHPVINDGSGVAICDNSKTSVLAIEDKTHDVHDYFSSQKDKSLGHKSLDVEDVVINSKEPLHFRGLPKEEEKDMTRHYPIFIVGWSLGALLLWFCFSFSECNSNTNGFCFHGWWLAKAGLDSFSPHMTDLRITDLVDCSDYRPQIYRWFTYQFTHVGLGHVCMNVFLNLVIGIPLNGYHGNLRMLLMYNIGVFGGACGWMVADLHTATVGMSGGCYCLLGISLTDLCMNWREKKFRKPHLCFLLTLGFVETINYYLINAEGTRPSNSAQLGGFIAGLFIGMLAGRNKRMERWERRFVNVSVLIGFMLVAFAILWQSIHWPPKTIFESTGWCWVRQVSNATIFGSMNYHCVRCGAQENCWDAWSAMKYVYPVPLHLCDMAMGGFQFTDALPP